MKYVGIFFSLIFISYIIYPYARIFQLDSAINGNNLATLEQLVDLDEVNKNYQSAISHRVHHCFEEQEALMPAVVRENITNITQFLTNITQTTEINIDWTREHLTYNKQSLLNALSFAFFESPTRFIIRLGELGQNPIHIRMTLQDWHWRITGIYQ